MRRVIFGSSAVLLGLLLAGCSMGPGPAASSSSHAAIPGPAPSLVAQVTEVPAGNTRVSDVQALAVDFSVSGITGRRAMVVEVDSPSGMPFLRKTLWVSGDESHEIQLPVAGTAIEAAGMSGSWKVEFTLDGRSIGTRAFQLDADGK